MTAPVGGDDMDREYEALRETVAVHALPRDVLRVSGPDATSYLQGQCSQEVSTLEAGDTVDALLLSPQGKIDVLIRVTKLGDNELVIDTDAGFGPAVVLRLERFRLRTKVQFETLGWVCLAVRGPGAAATIVGEPPVVVPVEWPGLGGFDLLGPPPPSGQPPWVASGVVTCGDRAWEAARIEAGVPVNGREIHEGTIAAEVGLVERTVSFTKGCFTGQELVARLDARGSNVARRLCGVVIEAPPRALEPAPVGAPVFTIDHDHEVGSLSSVTWSPGMQATVALATLHRRVTPPEAVWVGRSDTGSPSEFRAEARPLPLMA